MPLSFVSLINNSNPPKKFGIYANKTEDCLSVRAPSKLYKTCHQFDYKDALVSMSNSFQPILLETFRINLN